MISTTWSLKLTMSTWTWSTRSKILSTIIMYLVQQRDDILKLLCVSCKMVFWLKPFLSNWLWRSESSSPGGFFCLSFASLLVVVVCRVKDGVRCQFQTVGSRSFVGLDFLPFSGRANRKGKAKVWHPHSSTWSLAQSRPRHKSPCSDPSRPAHTSFSRRGRNRRSGESSEVGTGSRSVGRGFRARVPGAPELFEEGQSSGTRCSSWGPVGTDSEIRRTIGEAVASPRRRHAELASQKTLSPLI